MIPARIFQTWKSKTDLPPTFARWSRTFKEHNPSFEHQIWDDADNRAFIRDCFPWFLPLYDKYPAEIFRADVVRYFYLYWHGGIYADMDVDREPRPGRTCIAMLPSREWYPLDWSDPIHDRVRLDMLNGALLDRGEKDRLFRDAWMVTCWAHSW